MELAGDTDLYRERLLRFYVNVSCFLNLLVREGLEKGQTPREGRFLAESLFAAESYELRLICRAKGIRPFLAMMRAPWKRQAYLGRLTRDGKVHVFAHGIKVFFDQLLEEEVFEDFSRDLEGALDHYLGPRDNAACPAGCRCGETAAEVEPAVGTLH